MDQRSNPDVRTAGITKSRGHGTKECLMPSGDRPSTPEDVRRFRGSAHPDVGRPRVSYSLQSKEAPATVSNFSDGMPSSKESYDVKDLFNPTRPMPYRQAEPLSTVDSNKPPVGSNDIADGTKSRSKVSGRKDTAGSLIYPSNACYEDDRKEAGERIGRAAVRKDTAGSLLYPPEQEELVWDPRRRIYCSKEVGESVGRNYDWSRTDKEKAFGLPTPHDNSGVQVRDAMNWGQ